MRPPAMPSTDSPRVRQASPRTGLSYLLERRGAKSFANDLDEDRGVVITRAVSSLRFVESKPQDLAICPRAADARATLVDVVSTTAIELLLFFFNFLEYFVDVGALRYDCTFSSSRDYSRTTLFKSYIGSFTPFTCRIMFYGGNSL